MVPEAPTLPTPVRSDRGISQLGDTKLSAIHRYRCSACLSIRPNCHRLHSGRFKSPIHTATTDAQCRRDVGHRASGFEELYRLIGLQPRARPPAEIPILSFGLCDPLTLTLKHHLAFELRETGEDGEDELPSRALGVDRLAAEVEYAKPRPLILDGLEPLHDLPQAHSRASQAIDLGDDKRVAAAHVLKSALKLVALGDR